MVMPLRPDEWPFATDDERSAGWRDPRFDRRRKADPHEEATAHKPGDPHQYRIECKVCGERGTIRLTVDPETA